MITKASTKLSRQSSFLTRLFLSVPLAIGVAGCDSLIDLRVQAEQLCVLAANESFSGSSAPIGPLPFPGLSTTPVRVDFDQPLAEVPGAAADLDLDVRLDEVTIRSAGDLSFIRKVSIALEPGTPDAMRPPLPLGDFERDPTVVGPIKEVTVSSGLQKNVFKYLTGEPARLRFVMSGRIPTQAFTADVEVCVFVQTQAKY